MEPSQPYRAMWGGLGRGDGGVLVHFKEHTYMYIYPMSFFMGLSQVKSLGLRIAQGLTFRLGFRAQQVATVDFVTRATGRGVCASAAATIAV